MKRTTIPAVLAVATLLVTAGGAAGATPSVLPRFAAGFEAGAVKVGEAGFGSGWTFGASLFFRTGHRTGLEVAIERFGVPVAQGAADLPSGGRMTTTSILVHENVFILTKGRLLPFALAGIGLTFPRFTPDAWPEGVDRKDFVDRLALQLGGGLVVRVSPRLSLSAKARYNLIKTWLETVPRTGPIRDTDPLAQDMLLLYGLELGLGLRFAF